MPRLHIAALLTGNPCCWQRNTSEQSAPCLETSCFPLLDYLLTHQSVLLPYQLWWGSAAWQFQPHSWITSDIHWWTPRISSLRNVEVIYLGSQRGAFKPTRGTTYNLDIKGSPPLSGTVQYITRHPGTRLSASYLGDLNWTNIILALEFGSELHMRTD